MDLRAFREDPKTVAAVERKLLLISEAGVVDASAIEADAASRSIAIPAGTRYVRAQLVDRTGDVRALTNALWAERL